VSDKAAALEAAVFFCADPAKPRRPGLDQAVRLWIDGSLIVRGTDMARTACRIVALIVAGAAIAAGAPSAGADERMRLPPPSRGSSVGHCAGTDTCVRLGGQVRAEGLTRNGTSGTLTRGRATLDVRIPTGLGPMRGYVSGTVNGN
jgi:hypothetical protein